MTSDLEPRSPRAARMVVATAIALAGCGGPGTTSSTSGGAMVVDLDRDDHAASAVTSPPPPPADPDGEAPPPVPDGVEDAGAAGAEVIVGAPTVPEASADGSSSPLGTFLNPRAGPAFDALGPGGGGLEAFLRSPVVTIGPIRIDADTMPEKDVRRVVEASEDGARACYAQVLARDATARGEVVLRVLVDRQNQVVRGNVASATLRDAALGRCLVDVATRWMFPPPSPGMKIVHVPFIFAPPRHR